MKIRAAIIGSGALGRALAYSLDQVHDCHVQLYARSGPVHDPYDVIDKGQTITVRLRPLPRAKAHIYFFTLKAYDLLPALRHWLPNIDRSARIVLLCNGYLEPLLTSVRKAFPLHDLTKGVVTRGAKFVRTGALALTDKGRISWGDDQGLRDFEGPIFDARPDLSWEKDVCERRKDKWFCNTVLNTLCGAYRLPRNDSVLTHLQLDAMLDEVYALNAELWPERSSAASKERLYALAKELILAAGENENSMAVDVRLGRRTEVDVLSGVARTVENYELKFPLLMELHRRIEATKI
jgi:ketopantoate reductase